MNRWEYRVVELDELHGIGNLNAMGKDGWELVAFDGRGIAFFKRPLPEPAAKSLPKIVAK